MDTQVSKASTKKQENADKDNTLSKEEKEKRKAHKRRHETFSTYIFQVLKRIHSDLTISNKAMNVMNSFIQDFFEKIASEAALICRVNGTKTMTSKEIQTAVRLVLPECVAKYAISEGYKAVERYNKSAKRESQMDD